MNDNIVIEIFDVQIVHITQGLERIFQTRRLDHHVLTIVLTIVLHVPIVICEILCRSFGT